MDFNLLVADLAQLPWAAPHLIEAVNEEDDEALLPLDVPLMHLLPPIHGPEFALPAQDQGLGLFASQSCLSANAFYAAFSLQSYECGQSLQRFTVWMPWHPFLYAGGDGHMSSFEINF